MEWSEYSEKNASPIAPKMPNKNPKAKLSVFRGRTAFMGSVAACTTLMFEILSLSIARSMRACSRFSEYLR